MNMDDQIGLLALPGGGRRFPYAVAMQGPTYNGGWFMGGADCQTEQEARESAARFTRGDERKSATVCGSSGEVIARYRNGKENDDPTG